jgi:hypothetical protein
LPKIIILTCLLVAGLQCNIEIQARGRNRALCALATGPTMGEDKGRRPKG